MKHVMVTGANKNIGFETALALFLAGANVIIACRDKEKAEQAVAEMKKRKGRGSIGYFAFPSSSKKLKEI